MTRPMTPEEKTAEERWGRRAMVFWSSPLMPIQTWPMQTEGYVFFGNAVLETGKARFGDDWTGNEPVDWVIPTPDGQPSLADGIAARTAAELLATYRPDLGIANYQEWSPDSSPLTDAQWLAAAELFTQHRLPIFAGSISRMQLLMRKMIEASADGLLETAVRDDDLGKYIPVPLGDWSSEKARVRLIDCQMNPTRPFQWYQPTTVELLVTAYARPEPLLPGNKWLFVSGRSLRQWLYGDRNPQEVGMMGATAAPAVTTSQTSADRPRLTKTEMAIQEAKPYELTSLDHAYMKGLLACYPNGKIPEGEPLTSVAYPDIIKKAGRGQERSLRRFLQKVETGEIVLPVEQSSDKSG